MKFDGIPDVTTHRTRRGHREPARFEKRLQPRAAAGCPARGTTVLTNLLDSDDVRHMLNALSALGFNIPCLPTAPAAK
ncbi:hypothetical protein KPZU09_25640 [Klebsiella pneumoniae]|uniref:Uncharacterized protein n=1 Tax=Klebsiella pneumoniae TaxID=573 RepID=A0A919LRM2_KLEPN|nr:hypothetical protein KPZU09_25640 [Klebsiella pneumoniae]